MSGASKSNSGLGFAGPIGLAAGKPKNQTSGEFYANQATGGIQGILGNPIGQNEQRRINEQQLASEQARVDAQRRQREGNVNQLRAAFGVGDSPDAQAHAKTLNDYLDKYYQSFLTNQLGQVDNQYTTATRASRQNLARVGQLGSGLDAANKSQTLSDYLRARQDAVSRANTARQGLSSGITGQRQQLEGQINSGAVVNPDFNSYIQQQLNQIDQARAAIPTNTIGNVFDVAGESYRNGRLAEAQGNQGLSAFFGGSGGGGRIS